MITENRCAPEKEHAGLFLYEFFASYRLTKSFLLISSVYYIQILEDVFLYITVLSDTADNPQTIPKPQE